MVGVFVDNLFPTSLTKWRNVIIQSFINNFDVDILVFRSTDLFNGELVISVDYVENISGMALRSFDIYIFDSRYVFLNKYNDPEFQDGLRYINTKHNFGNPSFLFRRKSRRSKGLCFDSYDFVYSIFLVCYYKFQRYYGQKTKKNVKHFVHMFPAGRYEWLHDVHSIPSSVNLICAQSFTTQYIEQQQTNHQYINVYTGPYMFQGEEIPWKPKNSFAPLRVCFTSIGDFERKGAYVFDQIVKTFYVLFPNSSVEFHVIGRKWDFDSRIIFHGILSQSNIDELYEETMDILIFPSPCNDIVMGFPHGVEGLIRGVLLFTTDPHDRNHENHFNFGNEMFIIKNTENVNDIVTKIHFYDNNRDDLHEMVQKSQKRAKELYCYENTMAKIIAFVKNGSPPLVKYSEE